MNSLLFAGCILESIHLTGILTRFAGLMDWSRFDKSHDTDEVRVYIYEYSNRRVNVIWGSAVIFNFIFILQTMKVCNFDDITFL